MNMNRDSSQKVNSDKLRNEKNEILIQKMKLRFKYLNLLQVKKLYFF